MYQPKKIPGLPDFSRARRSIIPDFLSGYSGAFSWLRGPALLSRFIREHYRIVRRADPTWQSRMHRAPVRQSAVS
jgi:hypothetical protein